MHQSQCVFAHDPNPEDAVFFDQLAEAIESLAAFGLFFDFEVEETLVDGTLQLIWVERSELAVLTLVKDGDSGVCYAILEASRRGDLRKMQRVLSDRLSVSSIAELQESASSGLMRDPTRLIRLAIAIYGHAPDSTTIGLIRAALQHRHPMVRRSAAQAAGLTSWAVFVPELESLLKGEPNPEVVLAAQYGARACQRNAHAAYAYR